jgi:serine/threonine-protein kinase
MPKDAVYPVATKTHGPPRSWWRSGSALSAVGVAGLTIALAFLVLDRFAPWKHQALPAAASPSLPAGTASGAFTPPPHSLAVLPFVNMSGDKEQEYFSDGLTEEILNSLARINELQVSARTSSFSFKGKDADITTIAHKLNVASVLEGSVRRAGTTVRITAQLNDAVTGFHLWSQTYDRDLSNVLQLQTDIANAVANALKVTLLGDVAAKVEVGGTHDPAAFDAYLRGLRLSNTASNESEARAAIDAYTDALRRDPDYALAYAGRAVAQSQYVNHFVGRIKHEDVPNLARADAERAIALAPGLPEGHMALSAVLLSEFFEFAEADRECDRALSLGPGNARVLNACSGYAASMGRFDPAIAYARRGIALDPVNPLMHRNLGDVLQTAGRHTEAIAAYREAIAIAERPGAELYARQGLSNYLLGNMPMAYELCKLHPDDWESVLCLAMTLNRLGKQADAEAQIARLAALANRFGGSDSMAYQYAQIQAQWPDTPRALGWLELALRLRDSGLVGLKTDPLLDPLRKEPRFQAIERALKFPH